MVTHPTTTRRRYVIGGLAAASGASLAGCVSDAGDESEPADPEDEAATGSYAVTMAPVGEVRFERVPRRWTTYFPGYADMGVALGQSDGLLAVGNPERYYTTYYDELDGVDVAADDLVELVADSGIDKEIYYELDADVHLTDPEWLVHNSHFGLDRDDVDEIDEAVAPFLGNAIFRRTDEWHDHEYVSMYEAFETVGAVFGKEDQFAAFQAFHDDVIADVEDGLPAAEDRPDGLLCFAASPEPEEFSPYRIDGEGTNKKHFHDLGVGDALAGTGVTGLSESNRGKIDYETMLDVDPDALFVRGHETKTREEFESTVLAFMREHNVASDLTAVRNDAVYRGGPIYQGPIQNLFLTERFATLLYPGAFHGELFDRSELSAIVGGEF